MREVPLFLLLAEVGSSFHVLGGKNESSLVSSCYEEETLLSKQVPSAE